MDFDAEIFEALTGDKAVQQPKKVKIEPPAFNRHKAEYGCPMDSKLIPYLVEGICRHWLFFKHEEETSCTDTHQEHSKMDSEQTDL